MRVNYLIFEPNWWIKLKNLRFELKNLKFDSALLKNLWKNENQKWPLYSFSALLNDAQTTHENEKALLRTIDYK